MLSHKHLQSDEPHPRTHSTDSIASERLIIIMVEREAGKMWQCPREVSLVREIAVRGLRRAGAKFGHTWISRASASNCLLVSLGACGFRKIQCAKRQSRTRETALNQT